VSSKQPSERKRFHEVWQGLGTAWLPFADAASEGLPLPRLLRLSLFQVSCGMAMVLLTGTINRVMIVELNVLTWLVALMVSLPLVFAPLRALIGHKSDTHKSVLGWRRGPYIWFGSLIMFGGLAIMPFALLVLSGDTARPVPDWIGQAGAALAFLLVGAGLHTTQTAGLALATDLADEETRPRVVALLYVTLLAGMGVSALVFGWLLSDFSQVKLIKVIQGAAVVAMVLNMVALWKQEPRNRALTHPDAPRITFSEAWRGLLAAPGTMRLMVAVGLGTAAFSMQDVLLEPYGGELLGMSVSETTRLTALFAAGSLLGFGWAARRLSRGGEPHRLAAMGLLIGVVAFAFVIMADPTGAVMFFYAGTGLIGLGGGLFAVCTLTAVMRMARDHDSGIALGTWGAVQATAMGLAIASGGAIRDMTSSIASQGWLGPAMDKASSGYLVVYHMEILLLFAALAAIGPLARYTPINDPDPQSQPKFGLAAHPG
jgi:MFS transporter, BCD family, chlorophyll transporter